MTRLKWISGIALAVLLVWALEQVTITPLKTGEVYPPYSSLRSDPLGAKALYDSLAALPELSVERWYKPRALLMPTGQAAVFVLGLEPVSWSGIDDRTIEEYEVLARGGARLVLGFLAVRKPNQMPDKRPVENRWNVKLTYETPKDSPSATRGTLLATSLSFQPGPEWQRLDSTSTTIERTFGNGSIVLVAEIFPFSNEGLLSQRNSEWIAKVIGPPHRIVFDENHFGVVESGSVTKLMRKYRLEGAIAVLGIVTALFLWRSATSFLPPAPPPARDQAVSGRDAGEALVSLLRRGIPERDLLDACYAEWSRSAGRTARAERNKQHVEEEIARLGKTDPVAAYRAAHRILSDRGV